VPTHAIAPEVRPRGQPAGTHATLFDAAARGPNDGEDLAAGATNYAPAPINGCFDDLKFGRNAVYHKVRLPRGRTSILRDGRFSAAAAFRTIENQGNSGRGRHSGSMGWRPDLAAVLFLFTVSYVCAWMRVRFTPRIR
jgi:hypothetical protein